MQVPSDTATPDFILFWSAESEFLVFNLILMVLETSTMFNFIDMLEGKSFTLRISFVQYNCRIGNKSDYKIVEDQDT